MLVWTDDVQVAVKQAVANPMRLQTSTDITSADAAKVAQPVATPLPKPTDWRKMFVSSTPDTAKQFDLLHKWLGRDVAQAGAHMKGVSISLLKGLQSEISALVDAETELQLWVSEDIYSNGRAKQRKDKSQAMVDARNRFLQTYDMIEAHLLKASDLKATLLSKCDGDTMRITAAALANQNLLGNEVQHNFQTRISELRICVADLRRSFCDRTYEHKSRFNKANGKPSQGHIGLLLIGNPNTSGLSMEECLHRMFVYLGRPVHTRPAAPFAAFPCLRF